MHDMACNLDKQRTKNAAQGAVVLPMSHALIACPISACDPQCMGDAGHSVTVPDPSEIALDETVVANPEEIDLEDVDDASDAAEQSAEVAKQDLAEDNGLFAPEELHNFSSIAQPDSNALHAPTQGARGSSDQSEGVSPALAAIMQSDDAQKQG